MFTFWDHRFYMKQNKTANKLSWARRTDWKSSLIVPRTNFEIKKVYGELLVTEKVSSTYSKF